MMRRTRMLVGLGAILAGACAPQERAAVILSPAPVPSTTSTATSTATATSTPTPTANAASCPPDYDHAKGQACTMGDAFCTYAVGACACGDGPHCGGAAVRIPPPGQPGRLACWPTKLGAIGPDGCSYGTPEDGSACATSGKVCVYGECAWSAATATCKGGKWSVSQYHGPPPP